MKQTVALPLPPDSINTYLQVRMRCRLVRRPTAEDFQRFTGLTIAQIAHALSEKGYEQETRALGISRHGSDFLRAIAHQHIESELSAVTRLCRAAPAAAAAAAWLGAYRWKYDLRLLRAALRARRRGAEIWPDLFAPFANLPFACYRTLARMPAFNEDAPTLMPFATSPFGETLKRTDLTADEIEVELCRDFYCETLSLMRAAVAGHAPAEEFVAAEMHFANLLTLLGGRRIAASAEQVAAQMVPIAFWAQPSALRRLIAASNAAALAEDLAAFAGRSGWQIPLPAAGNIKAEETIAHLYRCRLRHLAHKVIFASEPSPVVLAAYVFCLECEAGNLNALAVAHESGIGTAEKLAAMVA